MSRRDVSVTTKRPYGVTEEVLDIKGLQSFTFTLNGRQFPHTFPVCALPTEAAGLLGNDFFEKADDVMDFECSQLSLTGIGNVARVLNVPHAGRQHSLSSLRVKMDAALSSVRRRRAMHQSRSQPAPTLRLPGSKEINGFLHLGRILLWQPVADRLRVES